jgi:hypothetical protein
MKGADSPGVIVDSDLDLGRLQIRYRRAVGLHRNEVDEESRRAFGRTGGLAFAE